MSDTFPASALRHPGRWLHLPSLAILALAGVAGYATDRVVDAWSATQPRAREEARDRAARVISMRGTATRRGLAPTRISWDVHLRAAARDEAGVRRQLARQSEELLDALAETGVSDADIRLHDPIIDERTRTITRTAADGSTSEQEIPIGHDGLQVIRIQSTDIRASLDAYHRARRSTVFVLDHLTEPQCTLDLDVQLERDLEREAQADLHRRVTAMVQTLDSHLDALTGLELGRMSLTEGSSSCAAWTATLEVSGVYRLR